MDKPIKKAVIAAAGYGTRMLPITKVVSKEILPIVDKPIIQVVVENLVQAGIEDIIIVTKVRKAELVEYFGDVDEGLAQILRKGGPDKNALLEQLESMRELANFAFVEQQRSIGTGYPVLDAAPYIGDEPFIYTFADDFFLGEKNNYAQLIEAYEKYHAPVLSCESRTDEGDYDKFGYAGGKQLSPGELDVTAIVEKPGFDKKPSDLASVNSFLVTPEVIDYLRKVRESLSAGQELYFNAALGMMLKDGKRVIAKEITGAKWYDTGNKLEYMMTSVALAAKHPEIGPEFTRFLKEFVQKEQ